MTDAIIESKISTNSEVTKFSRRILSLFGEKQYSKANDYFYNNLSSFSYLFDRRFVIEGVLSNARYSKNIYKNDKTSSLNHKKFCKNLYDFGKLVRRQQTRRFALHDWEWDSIYVTNAGYGSLINYRLLIEIHNNNIYNIVRNYNLSDALNYINHASLLFSGIWTSDFEYDIYKINSLNLPDEMKYYKISQSLNKMLYKNGVYKDTMVNIVYTPKDYESVPHTREEILRYSRTKKRTSINEISEVITTKKNTNKEQGESNVGRNNIF